MNIRKNYRWIVFLLAAGYTIRYLVFGDYSEFGGPWRFLTIWALICSFFAASRMMAIEEMRSSKRWDGFVAMTAVVNFMVVFLYWRLFFADPTSVTRDGALGDWWMEGYLHALGPLLQWIDALFIHRSFTKLRAGLAWLFGIIAGYVAWTELVIAPMNVTPSGDVTSGLPYPFLNDLQFAERSIFYGSNFVVALVILLAFTGIAMVIRRTLPRPATP